jgi:hypothetical protein
LHFKRSTRNASTARVARWVVRSRSLMLFVPPARPGESRCPGNRRRRGIRARWPLSVAVIAVTGAMKAVTGDVTVVTRGRDPCAGRKRHRAGSDRRGRWSPAQSQGRRPGPRMRDLLTSLAHEALACTDVARSLARPKLQSLCAARQWQVVSRAVPGPVARAPYA